MARKTRKEKLAGLNFFNLYFLTDYLVKLDFFHTTFKMYLASIVMEILHLIIMCWTNGVYAHTGVENRFANYLGNYAMFSTTTSQLLIWGVPTTRWLVARLSTEDPTH